MAGPARKSDVISALSGLPFRLTEGTIKGLESDAERASRLRREESEAAHKRWRETGITAFAIGLLGLLAWRCSQIVVAPNVATDDEKWTTSARP